MTYYNFLNSLQIIFFIFSMFIMAKDMLQIASQIVVKFNSLDETLQQCQDYKEIAKINKEKSDLEETFQCANEIKNTAKQISDIEEILQEATDAEIRQDNNQRYRVHSRARCR